MAGVFTNSNAKHLTNKLGRAPTDGELYMAHFMGATGAARLISAAESNPGATAAHSFPAAARANRSIFFDKTGRARNFAEVTQNLAGRFDMAKSRVAGLTGAEAVQGASFAAETARVARVYQVADASRVTGVQAVPNVAQAAAERLAPGERAFHNPYRSSERRQPISNAVAELWAPKSRTTQQEQARHIARDLEQRTNAHAAHQVAQSVPVAQTAPVTDMRTDSASGALGLFQDARPDVRSLFTHGVRG
jgi:hypothetical protein